LEVPAALGKHRGRERKRHKKVLGKMLGKPCFAPGTSPKFLMREKSIRQKKSNLPL